MKNLSNKSRAIITLFLVVFFIGCTSKEEKDIRKNVYDFFNAIKNSDNDFLTELYPTITNIGGYYMSDTIVISELKMINNDSAVVRVENTYTNGIGKISKRNITLFLSKKTQSEGDSRFLIRDSKNLNDFTENPFYYFAVKTGCVDKSKPVNDMEMASRLDKAVDLFGTIGVISLEELKEKVVVENWVWEKSYLNSARGNGFVKNNSSLTLNNLKYVVKFEDNSGNVLTTEDGYVDYGEINPWSSKSFSFYSSYIGNASKAKVSLEFDPEDIMKYINSKTYTGTECN